MLLMAAHTDARTRLIAGLTVMLCLAMGQNVLAQATTEQDIRALLRVRAGATCLNTEALAALVVQQLQNVRVTKDVTFVVEGSTSDPRSATLKVVRAGETVALRAFEPGPAQCGNFLGAISFAIALAIKAESAEESAPTQDIETAPARGWAVGTAGLASYGWMTKFAPGVEVSVRRALGQSFDLRLGVSGVGALNTTLKTAAGSFNAALVTLRSDACARTELGRDLAAGLCLGLIGGALYAAGVGVPRSERAVVPWFALSSTAEMELALSRRWSLALGVSPMLRLHSVRVGLVNGAGTPVASRPLPLFAVAASLGVLFHM
jgi:hypothetical protein